MNIHFAQVDNRVHKGRLMVFPSYFLILAFFTICLRGQTIAQQSTAPFSIQTSEITKGWSSNSVNAVIFRKNSLATHKNTQYVAFYDPEERVILAKRKVGKSEWEIHTTQYKGHAADAHNSISIMVDGEGYLHMAWDHHNDTLRYAKSIKPGSLELTEKMSMTGENENSITYPEFHRLPDGDLLFFYRKGESGRGNLIINRYDTGRKTWKQIQNNLIDGEGERNAYWQACVDAKGTIHISWVWRETWDVATNHDLCYARSNDGGITWENSKAEPYKLPIKMGSVEVAFSIPQNSELINQTSMTTDEMGQPVIATYWRDQKTGKPQYHVVYLDNGQWKSQVVYERETRFSLSGGGTKKIPISRPQIVVKEIDQKTRAVMIFRDQERENKPSIALNQDFPSGEWKLIDLLESDLGSWEPTYDTELWKSKGILSLFIQKVEQVDSEGLSDAEPEIVKVFDWDVDSIE